MKTAAKIRTDAEINAIIDTNRKAGREWFLGLRVVEINEITGAKIVKRKGLRIFR